MADDFPSGHPDDNRHHQRQFIREFIELYQSFPAIWDVKAPEYNDRDAKRAAYETLITKLREVEPGADKTAVVRKINSLRSAFRREYRKVKLSKATGRNYRPILWYYDLILFTADAKEISQSLDKYDFGESLVDTDSLSMDTYDNMSFKLKEEDDPFEESEEHQFVDSISSSTSGKTMVSSSITPPSINRTISSSASLRDEFDAVGFNVASKLRNMDKTQRIIAEKIIAETLFQGQMGTLIVNNSCTNFIPTLPSRSEEAVKFTSTPPPLARF